MKIQRLKKVQKNLGFFINNYKFRKPYQILIDGTFAYAALQNKFNIVEQMSKYYQSEVKLLTTQCIIVETEKLGHKLYGAMLIIKQFAIHKCGHEKKLLSGSKCLLSMIGSNNPSRYIIASQDRLLQDQLRHITGVPIMYLHGKAPTLEAPSQKSREFAQQTRSKIMTSFQEETLKILKEQSGLETNVPIMKKKRKKNGPNPLSCKKKKKKEGTSNTNSSIRIVNDTGKIKKRKRIKLPAHVKEVLKIT